MHEKLVIPPADEIELVERKWYTGPKDKYLPYKNDKDGIPSWSNPATATASTPPA